MHLLTSNPADDDSLLELLTRTSDFARGIDVADSTFFQVGAREEDPAKAFLYLFVSLERLVHRVFKEQAKNAETLARAAGKFEPRVLRSLEAQLAKQLKRLGRGGSTSDRFLWCTISAWSHLGDDDVTDFKKLTRIRNDLAHGNETKPPEQADVRKLQALISKIRAPNPWKPRVKKVTE